MRRLATAAWAGAWGMMAMSCLPGSLSTGSLSSLDGNTLANLASFGGELAAKSRECDRLSTFDVPLAEETAVGGAVAVTWVSKGGGLMLKGPRDQMTLYVDRVGRNLAMQSARPLLEWTFGVLESEDFNAVSAPGGYVLVTRGLLRQVENEAQLAGVLGHEIAHVTEKHAVLTYREVKKTSCRLAFAGMALGPATEQLRSTFSSVMTSTNGQMVNLDQEGNFDMLFAFTNGLIKVLTENGFESQQELDADRIGLGLVISAGYNPHEYVKFLEKIPQGGNAFPHHPSNADRQQALAGFIETLKEQPDFYPDYPFQTAPVVPLHGELAAATAPAKP
ncbi:MAG TPA: M48 family metalloprotease [Myxococcaceae bacterium]